MKATELRIGNWFNSVKFNTPVQCTLSDLYDLCANSEGAYNNPPIDDMFEPIPLTEEWLIKFGFKVEPDDDFTIWQKGQLEGLYDFKDGTYEYNSTVLEIKYVHQLQNLYFALTGEELTIQK